MSHVRALARLPARLDRVAQILSWPEDRLYVRIPSISAWSPAQHVDHVFKSLDRILERMERISEGEDSSLLDRGHPTWAGRVILLTGWIPRGRGEAPSATTPDPRPVRHRLRTARHEVLGRVQALAAVLETREATRRRLPHPLLGAFDLAAWGRFADVHTHHHLAIVERIDRHRAIGLPDAAAEAAEDHDLGIGAEPS